MRRSLLSGKTLDGYVDSYKQMLNGHLYLQSIQLQGDTILYSFRGNVVWQMPIDELVALGEYTDPNGPYVDDYFFIFVRRSDYKYTVASFYANNRDRFLDQIGALLGDHLSPGLCHSTEYASRVIWPSEIVGTQLFDFVPIKPVSSWGRIKVSVNSSTQDGYGSFTFQGSSASRVASSRESRLGRVSNR